MDGEYRFNALVLRNLPYGERENLLTVLTAEYGKKTIKCYGARKPSGHVMPAVQPFCYSEFLVYEKNGRWILKEVRYLENFFSLRNDVLVLSLAVYMLDLVSECSRENEDSEELLRLTLNCLFVLNRKIASHRVVKPVFELRLLEAEGSAVVADACARCGKPLEGKPFFSASDGGLICGSCNERSPSPFEPVTDSVRRAILHIESSSLRRLFSFRISSECLMLLSKITEESVLFYFERDFDSLKYYKEMKDTIPEED